MGTVYEVRHLDTGHIFAFKILSTRVAEHPELAERVAREAQFLKALDGAPYLVTIIESGRLEDAYRRPYLVMPRLHGATLRQLISQQVLPLTDTLSYARQILVALALVHQAGVVHRDVKPDNVFVQRDGTCTLLDFGVMKALYDIGLSPSQFSTGPLTLVGTPLYMAPEMASHRAIDHRADLFGVGLILAECLLGARMLPHLSEQEYLKHLANDGVPSLENAGGVHLPPEVQKLVRRATMFDPAKRYPSAVAMIIAINRIAETLGLRLKPLPPSRLPALSTPGVPAAHRPPVTTLSMSDGYAPSLPGGANAGPLSVSQRSLLAQGASAERSAPLTTSSQPTLVDSISPTRVKTPLARSRAEPPPPLQSQERLRFGVLTLGLGGPPPKGAPSRQEAQGGRTVTTLPLAPPSAVPSLVPQFEDALAFWKGVLLTPVSKVRKRVAPREDRHTPAVNDGLEGLAQAEALAALALEAPAEPKPAAQPRGARRALALFALGGAALTTGVVAMLAVVWWVGPPAVIVRVSPEPLRPAPAGVAVPAPNAPMVPPPEASAELPPEAPPAAPARRPTPSASKAEASERARLEARLTSGQGDLTDAFRFLDLCQDVGDRACFRRARTFVEARARAQR
jgi:serine/threonine-protein kinase